MKTYPLFSLAGLLLGLLFLIKACPPAATASQEEVKFTKDCFSDRKTQETLEKQKGIIKKVGQDHLIFLAEDENSRYIACNLEEEFKVEGFTIVFSGMIKEIFPHERWPAIPFVLQSIQKDN